MKRLAKVAGDVAEIVAASARIILDEGVARGEDRSRWTIGVAVDDGSVIEIALAEAVTLVDPEVYRNGMLH